jgi:malonyl-CoA O-methyltransferase
MKIVEKTVSAGDRDIFDLGEFLTRPLYAHLAHQSEQGPRESPVWFNWDGTHVWIIGGTTFPTNLKRDPRCALGIVDWEPAAGRSHHVGLRGTAEVLPFDPAVARTVFRKYFGPDEAAWDRRFDDVFSGEADLELVRFTPESVVVRDQSYRPTPWAQRGGLAPPEMVATQDGYDRWAEVYDTEDNPLVLLEGQHLAPLLGDVAGLAVADLGCGTGRHALPLAAAGARVTAVDFSEAMLGRARAKPGAEAVTFLRHDLATPLPLEAGLFDRVLCSLVGDHIADLAALFRELRRLCRADGFVVFTAPHPAILLRGVRARFIDPGTGRRVSPLSYPHQLSDYLTAAVGAGLALDRVSEHAVDEALADRCARARPYLGWPLLLLLRLAVGHS